MIKKKIIIGLLIAGIISFIGNRMLNSPNFLYPKSIPIKNFEWIFKSNLINKIETVYSYGNLKNEITFHDVDKKIRCLIWKFNEYQTIPTLDSLLINKSIDLSNFLENYFGNDPTITIFNKQGKYHKSGIHVQLGGQSKLIRQISTQQKLDLLGEIKEFGIFNHKNECEIKFELDKVTNCRVVFYKKDKDFYLIMYYGIDGYVIDQKNENLVKI